MKTSEKTEMDKLDMGAIYVGKPSSKHISKNRESRIGSRNSFGNPHESGSYFAIIGEMQQLGLRQNKGCRFNYCPIDCGIKNCICKCHIQKE